VEGREEDAHAAFAEDLGQLVLALDDVALLNSSKVAPSV
jgi:hypothetical protein